MRKNRIELLVVALSLAVGCASVGYFVGSANGGEVYSISVSTQAEKTDAATTAESSQSAAEESSAAAPALININSATAEQLQTLPGIGEVKAQAIVDYREENGPFEVVEDLLKVSGIGEVTLDALLEYITVED